MQSSSGNPKVEKSPRPVSPPSAALPRSELRKKEEPQIEDLLAHIQPGRSSLSCGGRERERKRERERERGQFGAVRCSAVQRREAKRRAVAKPYQDPITSSTTNISSSSSRS